jgi:hypothetical protein
MSSSGSCWVIHPAFASRLGSRFTKPLHREHLEHSRSGVRETPMGAQDFFGYPASRIQIAIDDHVAQ